MHTYIYVEKWNIDDMFRYVHTGNYKYLDIDTLVGAGTVRIRIG